MCLTSAAAAERESITEYCRLSEMKIWICVRAKVLIRTAMDSVSSRRSMHCFYSVGNVHLNEFVFRNPNVATPVCAMGDLCESFWPADAFGLAQIMKP